MTAKVYGVTENGEYRIECLTEETFPGAIKVIRESFFVDEAVCIGSEVNKNPKAGAELEELCADAALDGVSLVAVHLKTSEVAAVAFNKIQVPVSDPNEITFFEQFASERCTQESARSLIRFMATVDSKCDLFQKYNVDCILEIMFLATLKEHRNRSLSKHLCTSSIKLAEDLKQGPVTDFTSANLKGVYPTVQQREVVRDRFPKLCSAIFTSSISQKIGKALCFTTDLEVPYTEFEYNGMTYAERIGPDSPTCALVSKKL